MMAAIRNRLDVLTLCMVAGLAVGLGACSKDVRVGAEGDGGGASLRATDFAIEGTTTVSSAPAGGSGTAALPVRPVKPTSGGTHGGAPDVMAIGGEQAGGSNSLGNGPTAKPGEATPAPRLVTTVGSPVASSQATAAKGEALTIDAVVGQINGRPVFVSEILDPLDGALKAVARDAKDGNAWTRGAAELIVKELKRRIEDELILSEARSSLSEEQKAGLFRFLKQIESNLVSAQHGSEVAANEEYREQTGRSLSQEAADIKDRALITNELRSKVQPRVVVSWRDVKNEYERKHDEFNPPAEYVFRMAYTDATNSHGITSIQEGLAAGKTFEEIAKLPANDFNPREGGLLKVKCANAQNTCDFSRWPELNTALRSLGVGQMLGPIMYVPDKSKQEIMRIAWVYLERINQPEGVTLYDAQLDIETELRTERTNAEIGRYFERLRKRGNVSRIEVMADQLMGIATERYAPRFAK